MTYVNPCCLALGKHGRQPRLHAVGVQLEHRELCDEQKLHAVNSALRRWQTVSGPFTSVEYEEQDKDGLTNKIIKSLLRFLQRRLTDPFTIIKPEERDSDRAGFK